MHALQLRMQPQLGLFSLGDVQQCAAQARDLAILHRRAADGAYPAVCAARRYEFELPIVGRSICRGFLQRRGQLLTRRSGVELQPKRLVGLDGRIELVDVCYFGSPATFTSDGIVVPAADLCEASRFLEQLLALAQPLVALFEI